MALGSESAGFAAETYRAAAREHASVARELYESRRYVLGHYIAGLSVECILRAYRQRIDAQLDERHYLHRLAKAGRFYDSVPAKQTEAVSAAMSVVVARWNNNHRFRSARSLKRFLVARGLARGVKGDVLKENCRRIVDAALTVVSIGDKQWKS